MWIYENKKFESSDIGDNIGFVYLITHKKSGKKYIGKKNFWSVRSTKVKGRTNRKKVKKESDWQEYYGSNKTLQKMVEEEGPENFERKILRLCKRKGEMSYFEAKEQFDREVLFSEEYFNDYIGLRVNGNHL